MIWVRGFTEPGNFMLYLFFACAEIQAQEKPSCLLENCDDAVVTTEMSVLSKPLTVCSAQPLTGFFRDSYCHTGPNDVGFHVVCAEVNQSFLAYTKSMGNDLSTPSPKYKFPGLKPGDRWCLCASRWKQAKDAGFPTKVVLEATNGKALSKVALKELKESISAAK